jgi:hypothetical protein
MPRATVRCRSLGGDEDREKRQGPNPPGPRERHQQHRRKPAQSAGLDEMTMARSHGIPIDAARLDLGAPPPLDRVVEADDNGTIAGKPVDQQIKQNTRCSQRRPSRAVEHRVITGEVAVVVASHGPQRGADSSPMRRQNGAVHQHQHAKPGHRREHHAERGKPYGQTGRGIGKSHDCRLQRSSRLHRESARSKIDSCPRQNAQSRG